jgi:RHS repeat-associated protein
VINDGAHTYTYDAENRVVSVDSGGTAGYAYDYQNRRIKKTVGSTVTHYVWQGDQVIAEHNSSTGAVLVTYTYLGRRMIDKTQGSTTNYFLNDRMRVRLVMDTSGSIVGKQAHLPFGEEFGASGTMDKHKFTSYERDSESGNDYAINRHNQGSLGRFTSVDPKSSSAKKEAPQSWNRYIYSLNDPTNMQDALGLEGFTGQDPTEIPDENPCRPFGPDMILDIFGPVDRFTYCFLNSGPVASGDSTPNTVAIGPWTGFDDGDIKTINDALDEARSLLNNDKCQQALRDNGINVDDVLNLLATIHPKPLYFDREGQIHGPWRIFNGATAVYTVVSSGQKPGIAAVVPLLGPNGAPIALTQSNIFLYHLFFAGNASHQITVLESEAIVLIHEIVHLTGKHDPDFDPNHDQVTGSHNLSNLIIQNCYRANLTFSDLAFAGD